MSSDSSPARIAVLGAGASGLSAAAALLRRDASVLVDVYESGAAGGVVTSCSAQGFTYELGPNSMNAKHAAVHDLVHAQLGLGARKVERDVRARYFYVVRDGQVVALPRDFKGLLRTRLLSWRGKLRVLREPFVPRLNDPVEARHESVDAFFRRRFGREIAERVIDPGVAGIYSGMTDRLSMKHGM